MLYKCTICKTSKSTSQPLLNSTVFCETCKCSRKFSYVASDDAPSAAVAKSGSSSTAPRRPFELAASRPHRKSEPQLRDRSRPPALDRRKHSEADLVRPPSSATFRPCAYFTLCLQYMLTLEIAKGLFNRQYNRCYCANCYSTTSRDFLIEGGSKYVIPRGWVRFGLVVDEAQAAVENIWNKWVVSYHGTKPEAARSIIEHHQFLIPGDQTISGDKIRIPNGHIPDKYEVYTSPTIAYSGCDVYSRAVPFQAPSGKSYQAKIVLQCRQQPQTYKIQAETIGAGTRRICSIIPNSEIEYFTVMRASIVPYGLLVRVFE
ncbi:unnamed protein product [Adineta ricciae]|uniref:Uncharacterized protein n=1 Tax=Adineta ricciae TaxID=249248 RepID=A0A814Y3Q1_ADIRI|nr:unnamed protein product [Adineta ricciae]